MSIKSQIEANIKSNAAKRENEKPRVEKVKKPTNSKNKRSNPRATKRAETKTAGKKSAERGKFGIRIQVQKNGSTPRKALNYALRRDDKILTFTNKKEHQNEHRKAAIYQSLAREAERNAPPSTRASMRNVPSISMVQHANRTKVLLRNDETDSLVTGRRSDNEMRWEGIGTTGTNPRIIAGTFETSDEWENSVNEFSKLRPDIKNFTGHLIVSLPVKTGKFTPEKWGEILDDVRHGMGLDDSYPFIAIQHNDTDSDHVHLYFSRVSMDGKVHDQSNLGFRASTVSEQIEQKYDLPLYPKPADWDIKKPTKNELEKALRTGKPSTRMEIQGKCLAAMTDCSGMGEYLNRLKASGVEVEITIQENDTKISGITMTLDGVTMKAHNLGKRFTAKGLEKEGIIYEKDRDFKVVEPLKIKKQPTTTQPESENQMTQATQAAQDLEAFKALIAIARQKDDHIFPPFDEWCDQHPEHRDNDNSHEFYDAEFEADFAAYTRWYETPESKSLGWQRGEILSQERFQNIKRSAGYVQNESNQRNVPNPTAAVTAPAPSIEVGVGAVDRSNGTTGASDERNNPEHDQTIDGAGLEPDSNKAAANSPTSHEQRNEGADSTDSDSWPKPDKPPASISSNGLSSSQQSVLSILALADQARAAEAAAIARANRNANIAAAKAKADATPLTEAEKDAKRRAEKLEWIEMSGERNLKSKYCDSQYSARLNLKLKAQQDTKVLKEDEIDYKKLDEEVAGELFEAGFSESEIAKTILAKSPHDYKSLDAIKIIIAAIIALITAAKKLATEHNSKIAAEQAANQQQENSYYRTPEPK